MGGVLKTIGGVVKKVAPVASLAASFIPGGSLIGKILGGVGKVGAAANALDAGASASKQAQGYSNQVGGIAQGQSHAFNTYYAPLMQAYAKSMGFNPKTGQFNPAAAQGTPYVAPSAAQPGMVTMQTDNPWQGAAGSAKYNQYAESTDHAYDQAANQIGADGLGRGFTGYDSGGDSALGANRRAEASNLAGFRNNMIANGEQELYNRNQTADNTNYARQEQYNNDVYSRDLTSNQINYGRQQDQSQRMAALLPFLANQGNTAQSSLQGLGAQYQSKADNMGQQLGGLVGQLGQSGVFQNIGNWLKKRTQSNSAGTSTANAAPMTGSFTGTGASGFDFSNT